MKISQKLIHLILSACCLTTAGAATRYAGGDISLLPEYEKAGARYFDHAGHPVAQIIPWAKSQGMNAMRVRLFVNPSKYKELHGTDADPATRYDPNACQNLDYIIPLCRDITAAGMDLMLDFQYSDTWADPAKQWTPIDWEGLDDDQLCDKIYQYTRESLTALKEAGITPKFIQTGNEISYGMLWGKLGTDTPLKALMGSDANWARFGRLLNRAIEACREVCPEAEIILHTERVMQIDVLTNFYNMMARLSVDYDIIGLSYYPFWHGDMAQLNNALTALETRFPAKEIMIVETGYALKWQIPYAELDHTDIWPISDAGQAKFARDLVDTLDRHSSVTGLFWWWMEYNPYNTDLSGWYNAPLFDPTTGRASSAFEIICSFAGNNTGVAPTTADPDHTTPRWYDIHGRHVDPETAKGVMLSTQGDKIYR